VLIAIIATQEAVSVNILVEFLANLVTTQKLDKPSKERLIVALDFAFKEAGSSKLETALDLIGQQVQHQQPQRKWWQFWK